MRVTHGASFEASCLQPGRPFAPDLTPELSHMKNSIEKFPQMRKSETSFVLKFVSLAVLIGFTFFATSCDDDEGEAAPELTVTSISPDSGGEGTEVNINGTGFSTVAAENTVTLNGKPCQLIVATKTMLKVKIPADAGSGKLQVTVKGRTAETPQFTFIPAGPVLEIASITPATGPKGTSVVITGTGFSSTAGSNTVTLNGKACTVTNASTTQLTITIPPGAGTGKIIVTVDGQTAESETFEFVYSVEVATLAGGAYGFADGTGTGAQFAQPYTVAVDADGNVYVADTDNHKIRKITPEGAVTTLAGSTQGDADGTGAEAQFNYPYGVAVDADGNVYVADTHNHKLKKITPEGVVTTLAGSTGGHADGTGDEAQFYYLTGVAVAENGTIYVADKDNHKVRKVTAAGEVTTLAGSSSGYADGNGIDAKFSSPYNVAVHPDGSVYVADANNHRIRKITAEGEVTTVAGDSQGDATGSTSEALFNYPYGVAIDAEGNVFIADTFNQKVKMISDGTVSVYAGSGNGYADGSALTAQFNYLTGVIVGPSGTVYVADKDNHKIRVVTKD